MVDLPSSAFQSASSSLFRLWILSLKSRTWSEKLLSLSRAPVTADAIAAELETSKRSVYRDIAALVGQRAPIRGEAGVGYVLEAGFDMPPLMLTPDEIEAAVLGVMAGTAAEGPASWSA